MMHQGVIGNDRGVAAALPEGMPSGWWLLPGALLGLAFWVMVGIGLHGALTGGTAAPAMVTQDQTLGLSFAGLDQTAGHMTAGD